MIRNFVFQSFSLVYLYSNNLNAIQPAFCTIVRVFVCIYVIKEVFFTILRLIFNITHYILNYIGNLNDYALYKKGAYIYEIWTFR